MATLEAARQFFRDWPGRIDAAARRLGKHPDTLRHEIAGAPAYKFGHEDAIEATMAALTEVRHPSPLAILNDFATRCGCMVIQVKPLSTQDAGDCMVKFAQLAKEFADVATVIVEKAGDGDVSDNDLRAFDKEFGELVSAGQATRAALVAANENGKPRQAG